MVADTSSTPQANNSDEYWEKVRSIMERHSNVHRELDSALNAVGRMQTIKYVFELYVIYNFDEGPTFESETIITHETPRVTMFVFTVSHPDVECKIGDERVKIKDGYMEFMDMCAQTYEHHCELFERITSQHNWLKPFIRMPEEQISPGGVPYISLPSD